MLARTLATHLHVCVQKYHQSFPHLYTSSQPQPQPQPQRRSPTPFHLLPTPHMSSPPITLQVYRNERDLRVIQPLIDKDLSEPYSIFTYRYFIKQWPDLCYLAMQQDDCVGAVVCKLEPNKRDIYRGYIAMLAVREDRRKLGVGSRLVAAAIQAMIEKGCEEVTLEAEVTNKGALSLYKNLGFIRDKRLEKYYLNGNDAFRLKLRLASFPMRTQVRF